MNITKEELERMYLQEHLSMDEIGRRYGISRLGKEGVTRQFIWKLIHQYGIDRQNAERFIIACDYCKKSYRIFRRNFHASKKHYCSNRCYHLHRKQICNSKTSREGVRKARKIIEGQLGRKLDSKEIIHHIDGNEDNNNPDNLLLFPSQSKHLKHHHQIRINTNV